MYGRHVAGCNDTNWGSGCNRECGHCRDGEVCDKATSSYCTDVMLQVAVTPTGATGAPGSADIAVTGRCVTRCWETAPAVLWAG